MAHMSSVDDREFHRQFEACVVPADEFNHRAHVRLAYVYLTQYGVETSYVRMRGALHTFLECNGVDPSKYHDTMTRAWIMAVRHFMEKTQESESADAFIDQNPMILDSKIMMTHYSAELLFSAGARAEFVEPDRDPIPRYDD